MTKTNKLKWGQSKFLGWVGGLSKQSKMYWAGQSNNEDVVRP